MLLELAKPISFLLCLSSLLTVFHRIFFWSGGSLVENGSVALLLLLFAGGIAVVSGVLFSEADKLAKARRPEGGASNEDGRATRHWDPNLYPGLYRGLHIVSRRQISTSFSARASSRFSVDLTGILKTLPVQVFLWATGLMAGLFVAAWYMETYFIPYRQGR